MRQVADGPAAGGSVADLSGSQQSALADSPVHAERRESAGGLGRIRLSDEPQQAVAAPAPATSAALANSNAVVPSCQYREVYRLDSARHELAAEFAGLFDPAQTRFAVLVNPENQGGGETTFSPDALVAGPLAAGLEGPILTTDRDALPEATLSRLQSLGLHKVAIIGGTAVVSAQVEAQVSELGIETVRLAGEGRFETAAAVAREFVEPPAVLIVNGSLPIDALGAAAAGASIVSPVLYVSDDGVPDATREQLERIQPQKIFVIGGPTAVSESVADALMPFASAGVHRVNGPSRFHTAATVAAYFIEARPREVAFVTRADNPSFELVASALGAPILLTERADLTPISSLFIQARSECVVLAGAENVLTQEVFQDAQAALGTIEPRIERLRAIRDAAATRGLHNGVLLAGIASGETRLAHCLSEYSGAACAGPPSNSCGGGPVLAGGGDGPCHLQQGGLGMFQFDGGTFDQTLARDGHEVLELEGNIQHAVWFVADMVMRSQFIVEEIDSIEAAVEWMNHVRPWNERFDPWIKTVTRYYNGCSPSNSCWANRYGRYATHLRDIYREMGPDFWYGTTEGCQAVPPEGRVIDDRDLCFGVAGSGWVINSGGELGEHLWAYSTAAEAPLNWAQWKVRLPAKGRYRIEAHMPPGEASADNITYQITHETGTAVAKINQSTASGYVPLGEYEMSGAQYVRVLNNNGLPETGARVVADAIRITPVTEG